MIKSSVIMAPDLFGGETPMIMPRKKTAKSEMGYYKAFDNRNCGNCLNSYFKGNGRKRYRKCKLLWCSDSSSTDVSKNYVCIRHELKRKDDKK